MRDKTPEDIKIFIKENIDFILIENNINCNKILYENNIIFSCVDFVEDIDTGYYTDIFNVLIKLKDLIREIKLINLI